LNASRAQELRASGLLYRARMTRRRASSRSPFEPVIGFSRAVRVGDRIVVSGTGPVSPDNEVDPDSGAQARRCIQIVEQAIRELGGTLEDVVRTRTYLTDATDWEAVGAAHGEAFANARPAATMLVVKALLDPRWKVEIEAEAVVGSASESR
jgi:enamine deaminase RidA (YjgF/YER057c/UK114 family)